LTHPVHCVDMWISLIVVVDDAIMFRKWSGVGDAKKAYSQSDSAGGITDLAYTQTDPPAPDPGKICYLR